jgi:adenosylcobinamide-GDP ribazoletransferase
MRKAISFLTPFGVSSPPTDTTLMWFPLVGALLGFAVGGAWWLAAKAWVGLIAGAVAVIIDLAVTGLLHFDGLADAGDGLIAPMSRERRLEVMADPTIGAFGAITVGAVLLLRWSAFATLRPDPFVVAGLWCASRTSMIALTEFMTYARPSGLVETFLGVDALHRLFKRGSIAAGVALSAGLGLVGQSGHGLVALGAELAAVALVAAFSRHRLGGYTGDVLGAAGVIGETIGLLILATR